MAINGLGNSNITSMNASRNLWQASKNKSKAMQSLSSGLRINTGKDDPAGLMISEMLRAQMSGLGRALRNTQETNNAMSIAEGGLSSVSSMLTKMKGLAVHSLNTGVTGKSQVNANQMELNSALQTIQRVVGTTNYAGNNLLDGSRDFSFDASDSDAILDASASRITSVNGTSTGDVPISFAGGQEVQAERAYVEADFGASTLDATQEFTVTGMDGSRSYSFAAGTSIEDMAAQINSNTSSTGVNAYAIRDDGTGATSLRLASTEYGSSEAIRVDQITGTGFAAQGASVSDRGQDATLNINGQEVTTDGLTASMSGDVSGRVSFNEGSTTSTTIAQTGYDQDELTDATANREASLTNVRGGMQLQLGEGSGGQNRETVGLGNFSPNQLGQVEYNGETYSLNDLYGGGAASLQHNPELALRIIDQAISDVSSGRANIGAYQANALDTNANNLMVAIENTTATESGIRDADMADMMTSYVKNQLLENSSLRALQATQMNASNVLQLLGVPGR
ncbi:MAG: flagellin [Planctomycetaceae bacterium]|nr:flagellin [Planctomycetaceae bacterium]